MIRRLADGDAAQRLPVADGPVDRAFAAANPLLRPGVRMSAAEHDGFSRHSAAAPEPRTGSRGPVVGLVEGLVDQLEHAIIVLDAAGHVVEWLPGAASTFGYEADEMIGTGLQRLFVDEDNARGAPDWELHTARAYGKAEDDRWHRRKDGLRIWVSGVTTALRDEQGYVIGFIKIARDRTDVKAQLEDLQQRLGRANDAQQEKQQVLGTLAHELRNPLGPLANSAHLINAIAGDNVEVAAAVRVIERQLRFIEALVRDMLEASRLASGKVKLRRQRIELAALIEGAVETLSEELRGRGQHIETLVPSVILEADGVRLQQVLVNLIGNSSKFSPSGARIWLKATADAEEVVLRVEDRGAGIPPEALPGIFELFTQTAAGEREGHGLGLGLGVVKSIVELHGGSVQARSEGDGKGTEMIVRLPLRATSE